VDRQLRTIALLTLATAALGSVALLAAEHHRSGINTGIMIALALAALGSLLTLLLGSTPWEVFRKDLRERRDRSPKLRWGTRHYPATVPQSGPKMWDFGADTSSIRAEGMPCGIAECGPRTLGDAQDELLDGATVAATVERRARLIGRRTRIEVSPRADNAWGAVARWPDQWWDTEHDGPTPGRYRVLWQVRMADGQVDRPVERFRVKAEGETHVHPIRRGLAALRELIAHYRGRDQKSYT
jgi:hypothetical protein